MLRSLTNCKYSNRAFTFIEVMVSLMVTLVVALGFIASVIYSSKQADLSRDHLYGLQAMDAFQGQVQASNVVLLGEVSTTTPTVYEARFRNPMSITPDYTNPTINYTYTANFTFTGWGKVVSATANTLTCGIATNQSNWTTNEWVGHYVTIASGKGAGQIMRITANTGNVLTVSADLGGVSNTNWAINPDNTSTYYIDDGKTVRIRVTWGDASRYRTMNRTVLVPRVSLVPVRS
ncbi:MAG: prepilin-type N-terminal cleavage/methylation domain-containing protein [Candidatus Sumerlaeaceae bacterium]|nr:prepilin-type N-terminal cleavage/methylation domain-containing protein [Candidatus Sumerlaeaceae bacterium]